MVTSVFLYACESWTLTAELQRRVQALELRCYRKMLNISFKDHVTNNEVKTRVRRAIGPVEDLLSIVKRRKMTWYGHVTRSSRLAKTILQSTVPGGRRRGRQKKRWEDNINEWTGLSFANSQRASEGRSRWRRIVRRSSRVPQQPP
ncbi:endonuclease-reverse transcriptase [Plakobranchus ocellatus]|uniref:Endonuclease-reverse transcriptase n=1 Tax=Plakobranchus ocellatus TaxID=259542 RepID=A0AAV3ZQ88_9GAST|nr:endonuclease-reverse transcriptase [Plakobranchus ocellatus]